MPTVARPHVPIDPGPPAILGGGAQLWPWPAWSIGRAWDLVWVRWFVFYALFPFGLAQVLGHAAWLGPAALGFGLYFGVTWLVVLTACLQPERLGWARLGGIGLFSATAGLVIVLLATALTPAGLFALLAATPWWPLRWVGFVVGVGLVEEAAKGLPVWLFTERTARPVTHAHAGVVSGLGFGIAEAVSYSSLYKEGLTQEGPDGVAFFLLVQLLRLITLPLLHACFTGIFGHFLGLARRDRRHAAAYVLAGLGIPALLHGTYDTLAEGPLGILAAAATILAFIGYIRADVLAYPAPPPLGVPSRPRPLPVPATPPPLKP
jgi:hypothetical protein